MHIFEFLRIKQSFH